MSEKKTLVPSEQPTTESPGRDPTIPALLVVVLPLVLLMVLKMTHVI